MVTARRRSTQLRRVVANQNFPHWFRDEVAEVLTLWDTNIFKISDDVEIVNFRKIFDHYDLNKSPTTVASAAACALVCHPTPIKVYEFFSADLLPAAELKFSYNYALSAAGLDAFSRLQTHDGDMFGYRYYLNYGTSAASCAIRLLDILGVEWRSVVADDSVDVTKFGVLPEDFRTLISSSISDSVACLTLTDSVYNYENAIDDFLAAIIPVYTRGRVVKPPEIIIILFSDHVMFCIHGKTADRFDELNSRLSSEPLTKKEINTLTERYPTNSGRAGGKIFVDWHTLAPSLQGNMYGLTLARALLQADNDWELVASLSLPMLTWISPAGQDLCLFFLLNSHVLNLQFCDYVKACKEVHQFARMHGTLPSFAKKFKNVREQRAWSDSIYGVDIIGGRSEKLEFSAEEEMVMRIADPTIRALPVIDRETGLIALDRHLYVAKRKEVTRAVVADLIRPDVRLTTLHHWFGNRMYWSASGGAPGATITWQDTKEKLRLNKRGAMLAISEGDIRRVLADADRSVQWSVNAKKFESAKMRGILNTSVENYVIQAYLLDAFDKNVRNGTWYSTSHDNTARVANMLRRIEDLRSSHALMWDFADFNINHTFSDQAELYSVVADVLAERLSNENTSDLSRNIVRQDLSRVALHIVNARHNTYLSTGGADPIIIRAVRSLQSGERGTSFTNSMSSEIDYQLVVYVLNEMLGINLRSSSRGDKLGDDVFQPVPNMFTAILVCIVYNLIGAAGQLYKITNDYSDQVGARGEYLRYAYDAATPRVTGYPIRAMMGVIHGEFFSEPIPKPVERAATFIEQFSKLARRGWHPPQTLLDNIIKRNCHVTYTANGLKRRVVPNLELTVTPAALGGVGVTETLEANIVTESFSGSRADSRSTAATDCTLALCIPSGEGKTSLSVKFPDTFYDHESAVDGTVLNALKQDAANTGDWNKLNRYLRNAVSETDLRNRVLLTWAIDTVPAFIKSKIGLMLKDGTALRANIANRKAIRASSMKVIEVDNHLQLQEQAFSLAIEMSNVADVLHLRKYVADTAPPVYKWPTVPATQMLRMNKTHINDYDVLRKFAASKYSSVVDNAAVESGLIGGYKVTELNNSIAKYAERLDKWQKTGRFEQIAVKIPLFASLSDPLLQDLIDMRIRFHLGIVGSAKVHVVGPTGSLIRNQEGYPDIKPLVHNYGCIVRIVPTLGLSLNQSFRCLLDAVTPRGDMPGRIGRLLRVIDIALGSVSEASIDVTTQNRKTLRAVRDFILRAEPYVRGSDANRVNNIFDYCDGNLSLFPPSNPGLSIEVISFIRDVTLLVLENSHEFQELFDSDKVQIACYVRQLERIVLQRFVKIIDTQFYGLILHD